MSAFVCLLIVFSTIIRATSGILHSPTNVTLLSKNLDLVLTWDPPEEAPSGLTYNTEFKSSISDYRKGCVNITALQCDLSLFQISVYGLYTGRVQVLLGAESSPWVESNQIMPDRHTIIGSPNVSLFSNGVTLEISIKEPEFKLTSLRDVYSLATYNITYWKEGQEQKRRTVDEIQQNRVVLDKSYGLEPWSVYCVQVSINTVRNLNPSEPSSIVCESTTSGESLWVAIVIIFVIMAVIVALVVALVLNWRNISQFFFPSEELPEYLKETLLASPHSTMYLAMRNSKPVEEINHQVSVVAVDQMVEGDPVELTERLGSSGGDR